MWTEICVGIVSLLVACGGDEPATARDGGRDAGPRDATPPADRTEALDSMPTSDSGRDGPDATVAFGDRAPVFDGSSGRVEIPDDDVFSQPSAGALTVEAWVRPDSLSMPNREGSGYVHFMGKGESGEHEWVSRMYQEGNSEGRENRMSFYAFNLTGGLGAGSYFQDTITPGEWIHYAGVVDATHTHVFRDGVERDTDPLSGYDIVPMNGDAPVRIGTRDGNSYFEGSIARVAIYSAPLDEAQLAAHVAAMSDGTYDAVVLAEPSLVAYYPLDETSGTIARDVVAGRDGTYVGGVDVGGTEAPVR